jgi:hypothetical protein
MPLVKLEFQPGINKEKTVYSNTGGWYDCNLVRFRFGLPERMGGWTQRNGTAFLGTSRHLHLWTLLDTTPLIGVGTHLKYYLDKSGTYNDITPLREILDEGLTTPFDVTSASAVITVNDTAHAAATGDYVTISGVTPSFNGIVLAEINANHQITVIDNDSYTVTVTTAATSSGTGVGGGTINIAYEIGTGLNDTVQGIGWGRNEWQDGTGSRGWGADGIDDFIGRLRLWSADNFGEDLILNARDGGIYYWDATDGVTARAELLQDQGGASAVPEVCRQIIISTEDRHILALGCGPLGAETVQDPMLIRWPDQESFVDWTPSSTNTAGALRLSNGSYIVGGIRTKREILVWTDTALHTIQFTGPPNIFGLRLVATNTNLIGPNAVVEADDAVYWMGRNNFFVYTGTTQTIPCSLRSHVFDNININQYDKFCAGLNRSHYEVSSFIVPRLRTRTIYTSASITWKRSGITAVCRGLAGRTETLPPFPWPEPRMGICTTTKTVGMMDRRHRQRRLNPYIESSDIELPGEGYQFAFIRRLIPDVTFQNSTVEAPMATVTMTPRDFPGFGYKTADAPTLTRSASTPVELYTKHAHVRLRGRALKYRIESSGLGVFWRQGTPRIEVRPDGRR